MLTWRIYYKFWVRLISLSFTNKEFFNFCCVLIYDVVTKDNLFSIYIHSIKQHIIINNNKSRSAANYKKLDESMRNLSAFFFCSCFVVCNYAIFLILPYYSSCFFTKNILQSLACLYIFLTSYWTLIYFFFFTNHVNFIKLNKLLLLFIIAN